jgi:hypothetical protein
MAPEKLALLAQSAVRRLKVRSAFTPMLYLCIVAIPSFLLALRWEQHDSAIRLALVCAPICLVAAAVVAYFYFAVKHPEMLQSEDYQLRHESLELVRQKGGKVIVDLGHVERIATSRGNLIEHGDAE